MTSPKYSVRTLLLVTTFLACLITCGLWWTKDYRERRKAESKLRDQGAVYAYVDEDRQASVVFVRPITSTDLAKLETIHKVELKGFAVDRQTLKQLSTLAQLDSLMFQSCTLSDSDDLQLLQNLPIIKTLHFWNTPITDDSIDDLAAVRNVDSISFSNTSITSTGFQKLGEANPNVKIYTRP